MRVIPPKKESEERERRMVLFRCMNREGNRIMNPLLEEIRPTVPKVDGLRANSA